MRRLILGSMATMITTCSFASGSPWLPEPETGSASVSYVHQSTDEFYNEKNKTDLPDDLVQDTYWLSVNYGLTDDLSLDLLTGYAESNFDPLQNSRESGITDSKIGLNWRLNDEFIADNELPSIVVRFGVILQGDYNTGAINSIGDGGDGFEISTIVGKIINEQIALSGEIGYRNRNSDIPSERYYNLNLHYALNEKLSTKLGFSYTDALSGLDINDSDFTPKRFNELEEDSEILSLDVSYQIVNNINAQITYGKVIDGRNTAKSDIYALNLSYSF